MSHSIAACQSFRDAPAPQRYRSKTLTASPTAQANRLCVVGLLDVNVLVALLVPEHQHHNSAIEWFQDRR